MCLLWWTGVPLCAAIPYTCLLRFTCFNSSHLPICLGVVEAFLKVADLCMRCTDTVYKCWLLIELVSISFCFSHCGFMSIFYIQSMIFRFVSTALSYLCSVRARHIKVIHFVSKEWFHEFLKPFCRLRPIWPVTFVISKVFNLQSCRLNTLQGFCFEISCLHLTSGKYQQDGMH